MTAEAHVLGATWGSLGALLAGLGALLLLLDVLSSKPPRGLTFGGGLADATSRLKAGVEITGSIFVVAGAAILLLDSNGLSVVAVVAVVALAVLLTYVAMTVRLHEYMRQLSETNRDAVEWATWRWCATHPLGHRNRS